MTEDQETRAINSARRVLRFLLQTGYPISDLICIIKEKDRELSNTTLGLIKDAALYYEANENDAIAEFYTVVLAYLLLVKGLLIDAFPDAEVEIVHKVINTGNGAPPSGTIH